MGFLWIRTIVAKYCQGVDRAHKEQLDLQMTSMVLHNAWCHGLKEGKLGNINSVKVVVDASKIIKEVPLTRCGTEIDEMTYKELIIQKYVHGYDADASPFPHAAVATVRKKKKKKFDDPVTEDATALENFRNKDSVIKDYAIDFVTKMCDVYYKGTLDEVELKDAQTRCDERRERLRVSKDKRLEKKREEKKLACEAWIKRNQENKRKYEMIMQRRQVNQCD